MDSNPLVQIPETIVFIDSNPYCQEHGAMLCLSLDGKVWRCPTCHVGVEYKKYRRGESLEETQTK